MHTFTTSLAEIAVLGVGMTLLVAWITYVKTARIKASLLDLAQDDTRPSANTSEMEAISKDVRGAAPAEDVARGIF